MRNVGLKRFLDRALFPLIASVLILFGLIPDLIGFGSPGYGPFQILLTIIGCTVFVISVLLNLSISKCLSISKYKFLLLITSSLLSMIVLDLVVVLIRPMNYEKTRYGWRSPSGIQKHKVQDTRDNFREITNYYFRNGFKRWGNINSDKNKILIIGDSFTQMNLVANGEEWYAYIEKYLKDIELFVYGRGGYGTLQEYLVLDDYIDEVNPKFIIWQFCDNDYVNNTYALDRRIYPLNPIRFRPYLENNKVVYRMAAPFSWLRQHSFIAESLLISYERYQRYLRNEYQQRVGFLRSRLKEEKPELEILREESFQITLRIMSNVRERAGAIPIYMFNACGPITNKEEKICRENSIICIYGVHEYVDDHAKKGHQVTVVNDGHWNKKGNQLAGEKLVDHFTQKQILVSKTEG